ncbi:protein FAM178B isoform X4 [Phacochoerus africanus]|uniref:protein FAM178B isoform X4 n=1 Tax=Phacochoerus africanus TaxID=41426 RepID=UPI001FD88A1A|nr:protein FAM178B isoform X4 [Phacochoerus africanus]
MAGTSPKAAALEVDARTSFTSGGSECYVNSLDYLLQEKREQALEQEQEKLLLQDCPHLDSLDPDEDEVPLALEHRKLVERFSTSLQGIPAGHPGETVFVPMHHPLPRMLDHSRLKPRSHLEELFLSSPPAQQLSFLRSGLLSGLYLHVGDRPEALLRWLFQLLTWPPETSLGAFGLLWDLSVDGLIRQSDEDTYLWCPSLQEVTAAFHSLGARSPALHPLGPFQHSGRQLRSQLSLVVIARMLDQQETLPLWQEKAQLSSLIQLLGLMRPSSLGQYLRAEILPPGQDQQPKASAQLDHKVCYLCHSLLTLAGVVVSCQDITPDRWGELQLLCMQLDRHISTHIRESPQAMYWTRLKDLATQTYIRWQELLAHCQPQTPYFSTWRTADGAVQGWLSTPGSG